jgi:broad specificity phosphatase PhoE
MSLDSSRPLSICVSLFANHRSAGVRDSELTNHGYQQATRLGLHFQTIGLSFTHLFSSHLQRAVRTVGKIREAQLAQAGEDSAATTVPDVVQLPLLVEKNFGSMEGKKFYERPPEVKLAGKEHHRVESKGTEGFVDVESKDAMAQRADTFLDMHLMPLLGDTLSAENCIAIVSHGIFLSTLWKRLLLRLPVKSVILCPELQATARPSLEHLGGWSNTGYLELNMIRPVDSNRVSAPIQPPFPTPAPSPFSAETPGTNEGLGKAEVLQVSGDNTVAQTPATPNKGALQTCAARIAPSWNTTILAINGKDHLRGLKRTAGGIGSSRHDTSQKSIESFFKRRKVE